MQDWNDIGSELTKQLFEENPNQELEVLRAAKTMGGIWQQIAALTESTKASSALLKQLQVEQAAIDQSRKIQQKRHKKKIAKASNLTILRRESL
ncbi:hypothetical protein I6N96_13480 [Enterococcus sp. BWM-S5]|uniref:Uncharacterized protein n=1 Tax=Enterococcus larvae TaxID=2794352 RepID=A0ABS4CNG5_9ENTE|nr:hypothetical protein [Enterococcus larvae]MBP1047289.1 hypothetical protein [Enterococcus larvae]